MYLGLLNNSRMWKSRRWFLNGDGWQSVSYAPMERALVTGALEEGVLRSSESKREGREGPEPGQDG